MIRPVVPAPTEILYDELQVTQPRDEALGYPLLILLGAIGTAFGELHDIVRDTDDGPGWSVLMDPDRCPAWALPWLAQFAGVVLPPGLDEAEQRRRISNPAPYRRGTKLAMIEAAQATLTGTRTVRVLERTGSSYHFTVVTRPGETDAAPYDDVSGSYDDALGSYDSTARTVLAIRSQKPAGLLFDHIITDAVLIDDGSLTLDAVAATLDDATIDDVT